MVGETTKAERAPLLPLRHEQGDFFVCDIFDAAPKGDMAGMAHPIFTLSTKPDINPRRYETADKKCFVDIKPGSDGLASVHDRDVLIYCISQVMAALKAGRPVQKNLRFKAYDLLVATNRTTAGDGYTGLKKALGRLKGTVIETNITTNGIEQIEGFSLIDRFKIVRETRDGRMLDLEVTLSDWTFNAIAGKEVLTLNRRYFQLRKPLERRLYELARKHCGQQAEWKCGLEKLREKTGSSSKPKEFRRLVRNICKADEEHDHMPDFSFRLIADVLHVSPKPEFIDAYADDDAPLVMAPPLSAETIDAARQILKGYDVYAVESDWRLWLTEKPKKPHEHFLKFCKSWLEKRGPARG